MSKEVAYQEKIKTVLKLFERQAFKWKVDTGRPDDGQIDIRK